MKKGIITIVIAFAMIFNAQAQAFEKGGKYISLGLGGASYWHIFPGSGGYSGYYGGLGTLGYSPFTGQVTVQGEFGVHKYVGVGFTVGVGGRAAGGVSRFGYSYSGYASEFNIPIGVIANFHFLQLIADKTGKSFADKLDTYVGLSLGSGVALYPTSSPLEVAALVFVGPHAGVRYFFKPSVAVNGEVGYGKTIVNVGLTFKPGAK